MTKENTCFFTGHRTISNADAALVKKNIVTAIEYAILMGKRTFIAGGALGFDTLAAKTVLKMKEKYDINLYIYIPCSDQAQKWSAAERKEWKRIIDLADGYKLISEGAYYPGCMRRRNLAMARDSSMCIAYYNGKSASGTAQSMGFARENGCSVINIISVSEMMRAEMAVTRAGMKL